MFSILDNAAKAANNKYICFKIVQLPGFCSDGAHKYKDELKEFSVFNSVLPACVDFEKNNLVYT